MDQVVRDSLIVERYLAGMTAKEAVEGLGCSVHVCWVALRTAGVVVRPRGSPRRVTSEQLELVRLYRTGLDADTIAKRLGIGRDKVYYALRTTKTSRRSNSKAHRKYLLNERFFEVIDSEVKAYWLGFMSADGNVSGNLVQIDLHEMDADHLKRFARDLESDYEVGLRKTPWLQARLGFFSQQMAVDLASHGVTERKSATLIPWPGPPELMRHYWRGYFDGDGSIFTGADGKWGMSLVSKSEPVVIAFSKAVEGATGKFGRVVQGHFTMDVKYSGINTCKPIAAWMYGEANVVLARKALKAEALRVQIPKRVCQQRTARSNREPY